MKPKPKTAQALIVAWFRVMALLTQRSAVLNSQSDKVEKELDDSITGNFQMAFLLIFYRYLVSNK